MTNTKYMDYEYVQSVKAEAMKLTERCDDWLNDEMRAQQVKDDPNVYYSDKQVNPKINAALKRQTLEIKYVIGNITARHNKYLC